MTNITVTVTSVLRNTIEQVVYGTVAGLLIMVLIGVLEFSKFSIIINCQLTQYPAKLPNFCD